MRLTGVFVYPIKSCGGSSLSSTRLARRGLEHDRRLMVVDSEGGFLTQREHPSMALIATEIEADTLSVSTPGGAVRCPVVPVDGRRRTVKVWDDTCEAIEVPALGELVADHLGIACTVVFMPDDVERRVDPTRARDGDIVGFADGYPLLIAGEASLADLNDRLESPVPMLRFRPNLVFAGGEPYEEDEWSSVTIGSLSFRAVKRCTRCAITTVDPTTGERGPEPLRTLSTYRQEGNAVYFGMNLIHDGPGRLRVGDGMEACRSTP